jgi:hypothetical protein
MCFILTASVIAGPASAAHPPEDTDLEVGTREAARTQMEERRLVDIETGAPIALYRVNHSVRPGTPEFQTRDYLQAEAATLGLLRADLRDLVHHASRTTPAGTTVRMRQHVDGVPVYGGEVTVTLNNHNQVVFVTSSYDPRISIDFAEPAVSTDHARAIANAHLGVEGPSLHDSHALMIYQDVNRTRLVHRVLTTPLERPRGEWEVLVDAHDGSIVRAADIAYYVDGSGNAFDPDPLSSATAVYGAPGYTDGNDADTAQLTAEAFPVVLPDITFNGGIYSLTGPYADCTDWDGPYKGVFSQGSSTWDFTRNADAFEAVNGYHHIDTFMRYINETLGVPLMPYHYATGVRYDPHGWNGADNSSYSSATGRLTFGEGGVDDAEDADVLIHELGHGIHDWVTSGGLSQVQGLSEGCGDYLAVSYSRVLGNWTPADPQYDWVFSWDGHNPYWGGRTTAWIDTHPWPSGLVGQIHTDGQIWAGCMMRVWDAVGAEKSDRAFIVGLGYTNSSSNQDVAAHAVVQASVDLGYNGADVEAIATALQSCGYTVEIPSYLFIDGFESGDTIAWTTTTP